MQTRRMRAAQQAAAAAPLPGWLLLQIPATAQRNVIQRLTHWDRDCLRLTCRAARQLANEATRSLRLSVGALSGCALSSVRAQFPCITNLHLSAHVYVDETPEQQAAAHEVTRQLTAPCPWATVTTLSANYMPDGVVAMVIAVCPNLASCDVTYSGRVTSGQAMAALVQRPQLKHLRYNAGGPTAELLTALLSLRALTSLEYYFELGGASMPGVAWDLRCMTVLQKLTLQRDMSDARYVEGEEGYVEEQQQRRAQDNLVYGRMRLPHTVHTLQLDHMPRPALQLPCLSVLRLEACTLADADLARLSIGCPVLQRLHVMSVRLTTAAHTAPLTSVTRVEIADTWHAQGAMQLAIIFPALNHLVLGGTGVCEQPGECFKGASHLTCLDSSGSCGDSDVLRAGASMPGNMFRALATLPCLRKVHLNVEQMHVRGVQMLTQITELVWAVNGERDEFLEHAEAAFITWDAPGCLRDVSVCFYEKESFSLPARVARLADAIISWLVQAPAMQSVEWNNDDKGPGTISHIQLAALAMSRTVKDICIDRECAYGSLPPSLVKMARFISSRQHVQVQIQDECY